MINNNARPGQTNNQARAAIVRLAAPAVNATHHSAYSHYAVTLPDGIRESYMIPLAAAVAIEEAGYLIVLVGRLNG